MLPVPTSLQYCTASEAMLRKWVSKRFTGSTQMLSSGYVFFAYSAASLIDSTDQFHSSLVRGLPLRQPHPA